MLNEQPSRHFATLKSLFDAYIPCKYNLFTLPLLGDFIEVIWHYAAIYAILRSHNY